jgi:hypothetical protein
MNSDLDPLGNTPFGEWLGQQGMDLVLQNQADDFVARVAEVIRHYFRGEDVLFEAIRAKAEAAGVKPKHPNAWGAACNAILRRFPGLLTPTGQHLKSKINPKNHASEYRVYRVAPLPDTPP